jgi:predicted nucleic acid-binding protein
MCWFPAFSLPGLSPRGNEALILLAIHQGLVHPCFSEEMLEEYGAVLARPKFAFPPDEIAAVLAMFRQQGELYPRLPRWRLL